MFAIAIAYLHKLGKIDQVEYEQLKNRYKANLDQLECCPGNYRRHTDPNMWYSDCDRMSRDQWTPNAIAVGMLNIDDHRKRMFLGHLKRGLLFTTNVRHNWVYPPEHPKYDPNSDLTYKWKLPDITILACWGYYIRSYKAWYLYPLLLLLDIDLLINSLIWLYKFKHVPKDTDILNHTNSLLQAKWTMGTPISWLARKILKLDKVQDCLNRYFLPDGPALHEVFREFLGEVW